jgi:hypothetical protein
MKKPTVFFVVFLLNSVLFAQTWKVEKLFVIEPGTKAGQVGPDLQSYQNPLRGDQDLAWGVSGLGIDQEGNLIFLDNVNRKLIFYTTSGKLVKEITNFGGSTGKGYPTGKIDFTGGAFVIQQHGLIFVYDGAPLTLMRIINPLYLGSKYHNTSRSINLGEDFFFLSDNALWYIPKAILKDSSPVDAPSGDTYLESLGITYKSGVFFKKDGGLLFNDFEYYQPLFLPNDTNSGEIGDYLGNWQNINVWIQGKIRVILGPIGSSTQMNRVVERPLSNSPQNIHYVLSKDGYIFFTAFSLKEGGTIVSRIDLHPFLEEKIKLEKTN